MITEWKLSNFRSVAKEVPLRLAPLTVFAGANSSGKSTIIHSILLIAQTLESRIARQPLVLNGDYLKLGLNKDVAHGGAGTYRVRFGFSIRPHAVQPGDLDLLYYGPGQYPHYPTVDTKEIRVDLTFNAEPDSEIQLAQIRLEAHPADSQRQMYLEGLEEQRDEGPALMDLKLAKDAATKMQGLRDPANMPAYASAALELDVEMSGNVTRARRSRRGRASLDAPVGAHLVHFLPAALVVRYRVAVAELENDLDTLSRIPSRAGGYRGHACSATVATAQELTGAPFADADEFWFAFRRHLATLEPDVQKGLLADMRERLTQSLTEARDAQAEDYELDLVPVPESFAEATTAIRQEFGACLRYLGPLRDDPKPIYSISPLPDPTDVGLKGEYVASVLYNFRQRLVEFLDPGSGQRATRALLRAVGIWLRHMGVLEGVTPRSRGKLGLELQVKQADVPADLDLTNVGVGVSQVLPILVMGLLAPQGSVLVFEQPEIHLHPRVQSLLGDFFLGLVACGKQCIIETHSEYIIKKLRYRVAADAKDEVLGKLCVYFVEKTGGVSTYREVCINENGAIKDWPEGFFDEGVLASQQIVQASLRKTANRSKKES